MNKQHLVAIISGVLMLGCDRDPHTPIADHQPNYYMSEEECKFWDGPNCRTRELSESEAITLRESILRLTCQEDRDRLLRMMEDGNIDIRMDDYQENATHTHLFSGHNHHVHISYKLFQAGGYVYPDGGRYTTDDLPFIMGHERGHMWAYENGEDYRDEGFASGFAWGCGFGGGGIH